MIQKTSIHYLFILCVLFVTPSIFVSPAHAEWRFQSPLPQGNDLYAAWAAGPDDLYVGGDGGVILHWDGATWTQMETPTQKTVFSIHGLSSNDIWAVGGDNYASDLLDRSLVMHYDGTSWTNVPPPQFMDTTYVLRGVHAVNSNDVWAANDGGPSLVHWDGKTWEFELISLPVEGGFNEILSVGTDHLFVVGTHGQILHRTGGEWTLEQKLDEGNFSTNLLQTIWAADFDNIYAGGNLGQLYRRNGDGTWTDLGFGGGIFNSYNIRAIWGTSPMDIYFVDNNMIRHYTGSGDPTDHSFFGQIRRQWFFGAGAGDRLYAVGAAGVVHEYVPDGTGSGVLSSLSAGRLSIRGRGLVGTAGCGPDGFLAYADTEYTDAFPVNFFDGTEIKQFPVLPAEMNQQTRVQAMSATGFDDIVMNWYGIVNYGRGTYHWDGQSWTEFGSQFAEHTPVAVMEFWRSPSGSLFACEDYRVVVYEGPEWGSVLPYQQLGEDVRLSCLWGTSDDNLFVGTTGGRIYHYNGTTWNQETTPGNVNLVGIAGHGSDVYAVGSSGAAWRRSGTGWTQLVGVEVREGDNFHDIVGGDDGVYAAQSTPSMYIGGGLGRLWRFNGSTASLIQAGISEPITHLVRTGNGALYGIGTINSNTVIVTNSPQPDRFAMARVDLQSTDWTSIGESGVAIKSDAPAPGRPIVAAWWLDRVPDLFSLALKPGMTPASQQWMALVDPGPLPLLQARFTYDPALLPTGFAGSEAELYRYDGTVWATAEATFDEAGNTGSTIAGTALSSWAIAAPGELAPPTVTPTPGQGSTQTPTATQTFAPTPTDTPTPEPVVSSTPTETCDYDISGPDGTPDGKTDSRDLLGVIKNLENPDAFSEDALFDFAQHWMR